MTAGVVTARPVRRSTVLALLIAFPIAYWAKDAVFPWAHQLFGDEHHHAFYGFWISVVALHWLFVGAGIVFLRRHGMTPSDLGVPTAQEARRGLTLLIVAAVALVLVRSSLGGLSIFGGTPFFGSGSPQGLAQRLVWIPVAITAGICEEFVYRGMAITILRKTGFSTAASVALATVSFALMHGPAGIFGFPFVGTLAVVMAYLYLRTKRLAPGMVVHALLDLSVILT
jgi:membrane protease YdiL (CAAX protease family)